MIPITSNGVFPRGSLERIPGGRLAKGEVAESWKAMFKAARGGGVTLRPAGDDSSARSFSEQVSMRQFWCARGACHKAAVPGTSNHGWAKAVDVHNAADGTAEMKWLQLHGPGFGWTNDEGQRVDEDWHWGYVGGFKPKPDPLKPLPKHVELAARRLLYHRGEATTEAKTGKGPRWARHVRWRAFWRKRVEGMARRARRDKTKRILQRVLEDRDGVLE
jgi:hypothetical protein